MSPVLARALTIATGVALLLLPASATAFIGGTAGDDHIVGTERKDVIRVWAGDDFVLGLEGNDSVFGGAGHDIIEVGRGRDGVEAGPGDDVIRLGPNRLLEPDFGSGGKGSDRIVGGAGPDLVFAGPGPDVVHGRTGRDVIHGDGGPDLLLGETGRDHLIVDLGADTAIGGRDDDTFHVYPDGLPDQIMCGPGRDRVTWLVRHEMHDRATGCEREVLSP